MRVRRLKSRWASSRSCCTRLPLTATLYFAEIRFHTRDFGVAPWIELFLQDVDESVSGDQRTANARVMTRMWVDGDEHHDFSYDAVIAILENAKAVLLEGEQKLTPH